MTHEDRVQALPERGYTRREAEFLCLAALHSGYFVRRQYCWFVDLSSGWADDKLVRKLLAKRHARKIPTGRGPILHHLCARRFHTAIDEENNRHRRPRPYLAIRNKLMALDYVLGNRERYLATEEEKLEYFHRERGISKDLLPGKNNARTRDGSLIRRYFVEKFLRSVLETTTLSPSILSILMSTKD